MTKLMVRIVLGALVVGGWAGVGRAEPIEVSLVRVDNSAGGAELSGFRTTDIVLTIPDRYFGSQMLIELDRGTIFQHPLGDMVAPSPALVELYPAIEFDTYLANGAHVANGPFGPFSVIGAAVNLQRTPLRPSAFSDSAVDIAWHPLPGNLPMNAEGFITARVTLSDDAEGRWLYLASARTEYTVVAPENHPAVAAPGITVFSAGTGIIRSGQLHFASEIPEPSTWILTLIFLTLGAMTLRR